MYPRNINAFLDTYLMHTKGDALWNLRQYKTHLWVQIQRISNHICLNNIVCERPKQGHGTHFMNFLIFTADKTKVNLELYAKSYIEDYPLNTIDLVHWYNRFGFHVESGDDDGCRMFRAYREPDIANYYSPNVFNGKRSLSPQHADRIRARYYATAS